MSLTKAQQIATKNELAAHLQASRVPLETVAKDLSTSPQHLEEVLNLAGEFIEEPWILKIYLDQKIMAQGQNPFPYSALIGQPDQYWFLNQERIKAGKLADK